MISLNLLPDVKKDLLRVRRERNLVISISMIAIIASGVILALMFAGLGAASAITALNRSNIERDEKEITKAKNDDQLDKYLTIQNQLSQIDGLKSNQYIYSRLIGYLTQLNPASPNSVTISDLTVSSSGSDSEEGSSGVTMTIEGQTNNFAALDVYKNTLQTAKLVYEAESSDSKKDSSSDDKDGEDDEEETKDGTETLKEATKENLFTSVVVQESSLAATNTDTMVTFSIVVVFNSNAFSNKISDPQIEVPKEITSDGDRNAPTFHTYEDLTEQNDSASNSNNSSSSSDSNSNTEEGGDE
ncbi:MAG: hypothetical protein Q4C83_01175 [Candidatus Saccharibacteria bacterium]|nr:hypothetical protein [Candidatus Saccharibacteria bacterium]